MLIIIAFAEPVIHHQERVYTSRGTDVMFVLDTSPSMAARDINEITRIEAATKTIEKLVDANPGASYGLIAMGSQAAVVVPITNDKETLNKEKKEMPTIGSWYKTLLQKAKENTDKNYEFHYSYLAKVMKQYVRELNGQMAYFDGQSTFELLDGIPFINLDI